MANNFEHDEISSNSSDEYFDAKNNADTPVLHRKFRSNPNCSSLTVSCDATPFSSLECRIQYNEDHLHSSQKSQITSTTDKEKNDSPNQNENNVDAPSIKDGIELNEKLSDINSRIEKWRTNAFLESRQLNSSSGAFKTWCAPSSLQVSNFANKQVGSDESSALGRKCGSDEKTVSSSSNSPLRRLLSIANPRNKYCHTIANGQFCATRVVNVNTGMEMDLMQAENEVPHEVNPLSLHIMRLTSQYAGKCEGDGVTGTDSETCSLISSLSTSTAHNTSTFGDNMMRATHESSNVTDGTSHTNSSKHKFVNVKQFFTRSSRKSLQSKKIIHNESSSSILSPNVSIMSTGSRLGELFKLTKEELLSPLKKRSGGSSLSRSRNSGLKRIQSHKGGPRYFESIGVGQSLNGVHVGPIWCLKFSLCGKLLASAGQDTVIRIWVINNHRKTFEKFRSAEGGDVNVLSNDSRSNSLFSEKPFCEFKGHTSDILDVCWSKNYFILTSSMDKTVRLWHLNHSVSALCVFQHIDFVTSLAFHPVNDQYFLSGSLDSKIRLWHIPSKRVAVWIQIPSNPHQRVNDNSSANSLTASSRLVTAVNFIKNGMLAVVGTYDGRCLFYTSDQFKFHTSIVIKRRRGRGLHTNSKVGQKSDDPSAIDMKNNLFGPKITGIDEIPDCDKLMVTSNDSRIRIYDLSNLVILKKLKGFKNYTSHIKASVSHDGRFVSCGSENKYFYIWNIFDNDHHSVNVRSVKKHKDYFEAFKTTDKTFVVTSSQFARNSSLFFAKSVNTNSELLHGHSVVEQLDTDRMEFDVMPSMIPPKKECYVIVIADFGGNIRLFYNFCRPKDSSLPLSTDSSNHQTKL